MNFGRQDCWLFKTHRSQLSILYDARRGQTGDPEDTPASLFLHTHKAEKEISRSWATGRSWNRRRLRRCLCYESSKNFANKILVRRRPHRSLFHIIISAEGAFMVIHTSGIKKQQDGNKLQLRRVSTQQNVRFPFMIEKACWLLYNN